MGFFRQTVANIKKRFTTEQENLLLKSYLQETDPDFATGQVSLPNVQSGIKQDTVYTSIKRIADATAMTPLPVYKRTDRGREKARNHSLYRVLNVQANQRMTAYTWKHVTSVHLLGWGNAFSEIVRNNAGAVVGLNPMHPEDVKIEGILPSTGELVYSWTNRENQKFMLSASDVLHVRYMSFDGIIGCSPILHLKQLVGRSKAREEFQSRFYANGAQLGGVITMSGELTDEQFERHRKSFEELYRGPKNAGKVLILEGSQQYHSVGINPKDAEFIETSKLDAAKIAAAYGVPLQLINDIATTTRATSEQLFREFLMLGLNTVFSNIEAEINMACFSPEEQAAYYTEFNREALVQADFASMVDGLQKEVMSAIITPNEARNKLNLPTLDGGDSLLAPVNMLPIEKLGQGQVSAETNGLRVSYSPDAIGRSGPTRRTATSATERSIKRREKVSKTVRILLKDAFERIGKRERQDIAREAKKNLRDKGSFLAFLDSYYAKDSAFAEYIRRSLAPIIDTLSATLLDEIQTELQKTIHGDADAFVRDYINTLVLRYTSSSKNQIADVLSKLTTDQLLGVLERLDEWENGTSEDNPSRAEKEADNESVRSTNAITRIIYMAAGITVLRWVTNADGCPICQEMDGRTVGIERAFVSEGQTVGDLKSSGKVFAPPLHQGCACSIAPQ